MLLCLCVYAMCMQVIEEARNGHWIPSETGVRRGYKSSKVDSGSTT